MHLWLSTMSSSSQPLACHDGMVGKGMVLLRSFDGCTSMVKEAVACQLHVPKYDIEDNSGEMPFRKLPGITGHTLLVLIYYLEIVKPSKNKISYAEFAQTVSPEDLFNLIQAAHHFKISCLMDLTCQELVNKVKDKTSSEILTEFNGKFFDRVFEEKHLKRHCPAGNILHSAHGVLGCTKVDVECMLRQRGKETLIDKSEYDYLNCSPLVTSRLGVVRRREIVVQRCVGKLLAVENDKELSQDIYLLGNMIKADIKLADCLSSCAARRLLAIVKSDMASIGLKCETIYALSSATFKECGEVIKDEAIPVFVNLLNSHNHQPGLWLHVVDALIELAVASSLYIPVIVCNGALEIFLAILNESRVEQRVRSVDRVRVCRVARFLAVVCHGYDLTSEKVNVALAIVDILFQFDFGYFHIVQACYALQYLFYERTVEFGDKLVKLVHFLRKYCNCNAVLSSTLGVVGNIVRWGKVCDIQILTSECNLLECLAVLFTCEQKKLRKEACQIISNIAARTDISIEDICGGGLIVPLCSILEKDESDVKMEAAWAIFNGIYGANRQIDGYPEWE